MRLGTGVAAVFSGTAVLFGADVVLGAAVL
jgi:hypothetical protein